MNRVNTKETNIKLITVGDLGVGGGARNSLLSQRSLSMPVGNTVQRFHKSLICVGNVNKGGIGQFGYTYSEEGLAPTIAAGTHGYCIGHILIEEKHENETNYKGNRHIQSEQQPT